MQNMIQMNLFTKQKEAHRRREQIYGCQRGKGRGINCEFGINRYTLLYTKQINNKDLLAISYFRVQYLVITYNVRKYEGKKIYFYV